MESDFNEIADAIRQGDEEAVDAFWRTYFQRVSRLVRNKLPDHMRRVFDEEDVALSAVKSFVRGVREDRFPKLDNDNDVWNVLAVIAARKAIGYVRHATRQKRGGGGVGGESAIGGAAGQTPGIQGLPSQEPPPEVAAEVSEAWLRLLNQLPSDEFRQIAIWRMNGYQVAEIAERLGCSRRRVERRLQIIRRDWTRAAGLGDA